MKEKIKEFLRNIDVGEPEHYDNMAYFPLRSRGLQLNYATLGDAITKKRIEVKDTGNVNSIKIIQKDNVEYEDEGLMVMAGEAVEGNSSQDRMITHDVFVAKRIKEANIATKCIEKGRNVRDDAHFNEPFMVPISLRKINLLSRYSKFSGQNAIWGEIGNKISTTGTMTSTSKLRAVLQHKEKEIKPYLEFFKYAKADGNGFAIAISGDIYVDMFSSRIMFEKFFEKLATSYSLEAITEVAKQEIRMEKWQIKKFIENAATNCLIKDDSIYNSSKSFLYADNGSIGSAFSVNGSACSIDDLARMDLFSINQHDRVKEKYFKDVVLAPVGEGPREKAREDKKEKVGKDKEVFAA